MSFGDMGGRRPFARIGTALMLSICGCSGGDDGAAPVSPPTDPCTPYLPANWRHIWKPPRPLQPDACTPGQIDREYAACESSLATSGTCAMFRADANNATCLSCLFSDEGDASYGPIIRSANVWRSNTAGCIALVEGDVGANGCGARVQASSTCYDAACAACTPIDAYVKCRQKAAETVCRPYYLDAVCVLRPEYASCTEYATSQEYFVSAATFFCARGTLPSTDRDEQKARWSR